MALLRDIEIQIRPDGTLTFSALPAELLEVAAAIAPGHAGLQRRLAILRQAQGPTPPKSPRVPVEEPRDDSIRPA